MKEEKIGALLTDKYRLSKWAAGIAGGLLVIALTTSIFCNADSRWFTGAIGAVVAIYFGLLKEKSDDDKLFKELFADFNERYDSDFNDLINTLKKDEGYTLPDDEGKAFSGAAKQRTLIIDYFNLCAEEYLWYSKGRLPRDVWEAWSAGIVENLQRKQVGDLFVEEMNREHGNKSYYGLRDYLVAQFPEDMQGVVDGYKLRNTGN